MSVFSIFERWLKARRNGLLVRSVRKAVRLLFYDLFHEVELSRLANEIILAEMKKDSFIRISGTLSEIAFWDRLFSKQIPKRATEKTQITGRHLKYFQELEQNFPVDQINILDVGAGPFCPIGSHFGDTRLNITAVDPLAPYYDALIKKYALDPPVKTIFANAEKLTALFSPDSFIWVNAENSIDHSESPIEAIRAMITLVKPGGMMTLRHESDEALNTNYSGFHQWNLFQENGIFYVCGRNRDAAVNINKMVPSGWGVTVYEEVQKMGFGTRNMVFFEARRPLQERGG